MAKSTAFPPSPRVVPAIAILLAFLRGTALAQDAPPPQAPPPTRATFVSTTSRPWDVVVDEQPLCSTPCSLSLHPIQWITLKSHDLDPVVLDVGRLPPGDLVVSGKPLESGKYAGGIVATTFGGMALATGITLSAVGYAKERGGMKTAGFITGVAGALGVAGGIQLMLSALPRASIEGTSRQIAGMQLGVAGRF